MEYRLLIDLEAIAVLDSLSGKARARLLDHFIRLRAAPKQYSDYHERDSIGRQIEISVFAGHAIHYWIDSADQHVKILVIRAAGR